MVQIKIPFFCCQYHQDPLHWQNLMKHAPPSAPLIGCHENQEKASAEEIPSSSRSPGWQLQPPKTWLPPLARLTGLTRLLLSEPSSISCQKLWKEKRSTRLPESHFPSNGPEVHLLQGLNCKKLQTKRKFKRKPLFFKLQCLNGLLTHQYSINLHREAWYVDVWWTKLRGCIFPPLVTSCRKLNQGYPSLKKRHHIQKTIAYQAQFITAYFGRWLVYMRIAPPQTVHAAYLWMKLRESRASADTLLAILAAALPSWYTAHHCMPWQNSEDELEDLTKHIFIFSLAIEFRPLMF